MLKLVTAYRSRGHLAADLDPLGMAQKLPAPDLDPAEAARAFAEALAAGRGGIYAQVLADRPHLALPRVRFVRREEIMTPNSFKIRYLG